MEEPIVPFPEEGSWMGIRIKVKNNGSTAAEDCKASMLVGNTEFRIAWTIPKGDHTVTINAHDAEYIDLCAFEEFRLPYIEPSTLIFTTERGYSRELGASRTFRDLLLVPNQASAGLETLTVDAKLKVSSRNARQAVRNIRIQTEQQGNKKIVQFV
jgi:hypothetical protein